MEYQSLNYLGLNEKEKEVYILLLKLGTSRASNLLQKININRSVLYSILNSLENKGFITKIIKQNLTYFNPINPNLLLKKYKENEKILEKEIKKLTEISSIKIEKPKIQILSGHNGILTLMQDIIDSKEENLVIGEEKHYHQIVEIYSKQFLTTIEELDLKERVLVTHGLKTSPNTKNSEKRYLPKGYEFSSSVGIYGNKVVIAFWKDPLTFLWIEDKDLAESYKNIFEILWKIRKKRIN